MVTPQAKKLCVKAMLDHGLKERQACRLVGVCRGTVRYTPRKQDEQYLKDKIKKIAYERRRFGYRRIHMCLKKEGYRVNHKKVFRIYQEINLKVVKRKARKRAIGIRFAKKQSSKPNECWSLDFVHDTLWSGRKIRLLNVIDEFTRECIGIVVDTSIGGQRVGRELDKMIELRGFPEKILSDNGTEFTSNAILNWAQEKGVLWEYIEPGKPYQNGYIESFNGKCKRLI